MPRRRALLHYSVYLCLHVNVPRLFWEWMLAVELCTSKPASKAAPATSPASSPSKPVSFAFTA
jgi:hypothetical protein